MMNRRRKIIITLIIVIIIVIIAIVPLLFKKEEPKPLTEEITKVDIEQKTDSQKPMVDYISSNSEIFTGMDVSSVEEVFRDGDYTVLKVSFVGRTGKSDYNGFAIARNETILIPPGSDYTEQFVKDAKIPDSVIQKLQESVREL